jgi:hypothetical protein
VRNLEFVNQYAIRPVDEIILKDKNPDYRVLDLSISTFNDAHVSYHHKTIGGYSPTKMQRYQDMIDYYIIPEMQQIGKDINGSKTIDEVQAKLGNYPVLNMLNTKYIILGADNPPVVNNAAMGNAWFVNDVKWAEDAKGEISMLGSVDLKSTAVVSKEFSKNLEGFVPGAETQKAAPTLATAGDTLQSENITLTGYSPNKLNYSYDIPSEKVAVFSEIYYPAGWKATIDGQLEEILRADYVLRALKLPAGKHEIEFVYQPESFKKGALYSRISSGLLLILLIGGAGAEVARKRKESIKKIS